MQRAPLPVDVTSSWWDYVVDVADILAGLGAAGALLIAAFTYRHQVRDAQRQRAALVNLQLGLEPTAPSLSVVNDCDQPIFDVEVQLILQDGDLLDPERDRQAPFVRSKRWNSLSAFEEQTAYFQIAFGPDPTPTNVLWALVNFTDSVGHRWGRSLAGGFGKLPKRKLGRLRKRRHPLEVDPEIEKRIDEHLGRPAVLKLQIDPEILSDYTDGLNDASDTTERDP